MLYYTDPAYHMPTDDIAHDSHIMKEIEEDNQVLKFQNKQKNTKLPTVYPYRLIIFFALLVVM